MTDQNAELDAALERVIEAARAHLAAVTAAAGPGRRRRRLAGVRRPEQRLASPTTSSCSTRSARSRPWDVESIDPDEADERFGVGLGGADGDEPATRTRR